MKGLVARISITRCVLFLIVLAFVVRDASTERVTAQVLPAIPKDLQTLGAAGTLTHTVNLPIIFRPLGPCTIAPNDATKPGARLLYSFDQILPCLNTPDLVSQFTHNNITYDAAFAEQACNSLDGETCYFPAWIIYQHGADVCRGFAILQCYLLEKNGWDANMIGLSIESSTVGHNVCGVNTNGKILVLDNGWIEGNFNTLADIAYHYIATGLMTPGGTLRTIRASAIDQVIMDWDVLALPWTMHPY